MSDPAGHRWPVRVYYEDTDLAGVVYYANYLRFIERARTEMLRAAGVEQTGLQADTGLVFVVRQLTADYLTPARFDDLLTVATVVERVSGARVTLAQTVWREDQRLFAARVALAAVSADGRPCRLPAVVRTALGA